MPINTIENGMTFAQVRTILNQVITRLNELENISSSYNELEDLPAIDGIPLTSESSIEDFPLQLSSLENYSELHSDVLSEAARIASASLEAAISSRMPLNVSTLNPISYDLSDSLLLIVGTADGTVFKVTLANLILFLKSSVLRLNDQYLRVLG